MALVGRVDSPVTACPFSISGRVLPQYLMHCISIAYTRTQTRTQTRALHLIRKTYYLPTTALIKINDCKDSS